MSESIEPAPQVIFAAPQVRLDSDSKPVSETAWSFTGAIATHDISLQRLDQKRQLWIPTDRIFQGERFRLAFSNEAAPTNEGTSMRRYWYEKDRLDSVSYIHVPLSPKRLRGLSIALILFGLTVLCLAVIALTSGK